MGSRRNHDIAHACAYPLAMDSSRNASACEHRADSGETLDRMPAANVSS
jgi:hypothetical protein